MHEQDLTEATQRLQAACELETMAAAEAKAAARDAATAEGMARDAGVVAAAASGLVRRAAGALDREQAPGPPAPSLAAALEQEAQAIAAYVAAFEAAAEAQEAARVARVEATQSGLEVRRARARVGSLLTSLAAQRPSDP